jgi:prophage regulatory protein
MISRNPSINPLPTRADCRPALPLPRATPCELRENQSEDPALDGSSGPRRMLNEKQVLGIIPVSRTTLFRMEKAGRFPRSTYISPNRRIWYADEIIAWQSTIDEFNPNRRRGRRREQVQS